MTGPKRRKAKTDESETLSPDDADVVLLDTHGTVHVMTHDELPRDARGNVIGVWHVAALSLAVGEAPDPRVWASRNALEGALVDRAVSLGYHVAPGPDESPQIE